MAKCKNGWKLHIGWRLCTGGLATGKTSVLLDSLTLCVVTKGKVNQTNKSVDMTETSPTPETRSFAHESDFATLSKNSWRCLRATRGWRFRISNQKKSRGSRWLARSCLICCVLMHVLIVVVSLACVPTPSACSLASVSGSKGADSALYTTPKHTFGVTFVLGCTTGSPSLSVCFGPLYNLVEELVALSRFIFT